jgi:hypothetical protein
MTNICLNFEGPFTFMGSVNSVFHSPLAACPGVYLWTVRQHSDKTHLIHYVGETFALGKRHREHLIQSLGLNYGIFAPDKMQQGVCELVWPVNIFFAELKSDDRLRKHIEGCIGWNLRNNHREAKTLYPDDNHIGTMADKNRGELLIGSPERIRGLDSRIPY